MIREIAPLGTILGVWAHPDDESYLCAGIMAAASVNGQRVACVTATHGEAGTTDESRWPLATLGWRRDQELIEALSILGVTEHYWLDYPDGACEQVPIPDAVDNISELMERVDPDSVLTFGPDGMTGHPDHTAVSEWTTTAFHAVAKVGTRLYYATATPAWLEFVLPTLEKFDVFFAGMPSVTQEADLAISYTLPPEIMRKKLRAVKAQASQSEALLGAVGESFFEASNSSEFFALAAQKG